LPIANIFLTTQIGTGSKVDDTTLKERINKKKAQFAVAKLGRNIFWEDSNK
jgi:hypothetical protein